MASTGSALSPQVLTADEYESISENVRNKLEIHVKKLNEERLIATALLETTKLNSDQSISSLEHVVENKVKECHDLKVKLESTTRELEDFKGKWEGLQNEVSNLKEYISLLETENNSFKSQRNTAVDERDDLLKIVERRNSELHHLQEDYRSLSSQLQAAITAKCEAIVKSEEVESLRLDLEFKEKRMEGERERMNREIECLTSELNRATEEVINVRRENTTRRLTLETQLAEKIEELKIAQQSLEGLEESNAKLQAKLEDSLRKLMAQHETEIKLQKTFDEELQQQTKLTELYRGLSEDNNSKADKLERAIKELQDLLHEAVEENEKTETKLKLLAEESDRKLEEKIESIEKLKQELKSANDLIDVVREDRKMEMVEELSPAAANIIHIFNSRMTLTQIYMEMKDLSQELVKEKQENKRLNECLDTIVQEIEMKAPELQKLRDEHASLMENLNQMCGALDTCSKENEVITKEMREIKKLKEQFERDNERLRCEMVDLSRQVCFLLQENQEIRNNEKGAFSQDQMDGSGEVTSSQVITQHLVTFNGIQELQENNQKLIALVRELSKKAEEDESRGLESYDELKTLLEIRTCELGEYKEKQVRYNKMMERAMQQLQYLQGKLMNREGIGNPSLEVRTTSQSPEKRSVLLQSGSTSCDIHDDEIAELTKKLHDTENALQELQEETDIYRTERQTNEQMLTEQIETMRNEIRELRTKCSKMTSQLDYSEERFKIMQANCNTYKTQIAALESRNKNYNTTIVKQEQTLTYLQDEVINCQKKLSVSEVSLENSRTECALLRDSEARLQRERESMHRDQHGQAMLLANLDTIRASLERSEVEGRARLEGRLDESLRECTALRRRLQEEQDRFRELTHHLERQTESAKSRQEEEAKLAARYKEELEAIKEELTKAKSTIEELNRRVGDSGTSLVRIEKSEQVAALEKELRELKIQLKCFETELTGTKELLAMEKEHTKQFSEVSGSLELKLSDITEEYNRYKENSEKRIAECMQKEEECLKKISALESKLASVQTGSSQSSIQLSAQLRKAQEDLKVIQEEFDKAKHDLTNARMEVASLSAAAQAAEDKYAHEVVMHSTDVQNLLQIKKELTEISAQVKALHAAKASAEQALEQGKENWEEREVKLQKELLETQQRIADLDMHNTKLHEQLEELSSKVAILHAQGVMPSPNTSFSEDSGNKSINSSFSEDEVKSTDQLMQIIKYLRREKNIAVSRCDVLKAENIRVSSQLELIKKQLEEARSLPLVEREKSDVAVLTASKHAELLRKLETLSALTDSNRMLRSERDALQAQVKECQLRVESLEQELGPLREQNRDLTARVDSLDAENVALRGEAGRLRQRVNFLIERSSKTSPEDWRRLQQERETLARQVAADRETLQRKDEEARALRQDKTRLEEQVNTLTRQQQQQADELKRQAEDLNTVHQRLNKLTQELNESRTLFNKKNEELAKITEDLGAKEALLADARSKEFQIRKIAKKYKTQYEELTKSSEDDKKKVEELEKSLTEAQNASTQETEVSPEIQEQFRDEGRREVEIRMVEVESRHTDRVKELVDQVTSSHEEAETLRKENDSLKSSAANNNERAKQVLQTARQKIMQLTESKTALQKELDETKSRLQQAEQGQEEETVRMSALKSQYENRIARLEKENSDMRNEKQHEVETLNQRINQLQRQLEKLQGSKPSTSSSSGEKAGSDPPTANIKPMAGPSSTGVKQTQSQQSVTVTPWVGRGDTPFASIRPMSMQSRTAAVLPTSQSASSTISPATPVLVAPQQQLVHTTGTGGSGGGPEGLSSSPTSSHTDYIPTMPATSSAGSGSSVVRQVAVPPTVTTVSPSTREEPPQSAQSVAESTQDIEAEPIVTENPQAAATQQQQQSQQQQPRQQPDQVSQHKVEPQVQSQQVQQQSQPQPQSLQQQQHQTQSLPLQSQPASGTQQISQTVAASTQQGQQAVAMVLPRVEQLPATQPLTGQAQQVEQAAAAPSSQASSSSNTVTTSQAGLGVKRAREPENEEPEDEAKIQGKRSRLTGSGQQDMFPASSDSALEVEYQVPTSSQRDQEDEMVYSEEDEEGIAVEGAIEEPDDGQEFDEDDHVEGYTVQVYRDEQDLTSFEEVEGENDIDEENPAGENNEAEIMDDSNEVPNQSGTGSPVRPTGDASVRPPSSQQHAEASSSGTSTGGGIEVGSAGTAGVGTSRVASSVMGFGRGPARSVPPLARQQQQTQLLLGYEESGDDSIVPSTPTLFVPRRSDGFGEAVSSPQVPQQTRFTFSESNTPAARSGIAQGGSEGIDDNRMDLNQLEEAGTGRSVPTTPPQVSPQEMSSEVGQSEGGSEEAVPQDSIQSEASGSQTTVPSITVTEASEDDATETAEEMPPPELAEYDESGEQREGDQEPEDGLEIVEEVGDGVSSEGEKSQPMEEEEGREAEATEAGDSQEAPRRVTRAANTARRSTRNVFRGQRGRGSMRPTPIIWNEPGSSMASQTPRGRACLIPSMRGSPSEGIRGNFHRGNQRGRRPRGKPKGNFQSPYQMRF